MTWILAIALALIAFAAGAMVLRLPRQAWSLLGAALAFGLAGYALQASPNLPGAPASPAARQAADGEEMIAMRRRILGVEDRPVAPYLLTADAFARRGQYSDAARLLGAAVREHPRDAEAWLALGNALVEHGEGTLSPAAVYAFRRADGLEPDRAGATFFLGLALVRRGDLAAAHRMWSAKLAAMPQDAPGRAEFAESFTRLDSAMRRMAGEIEPAAPSGS